MRHGVSEANRLRLVTGKPTDELTSLGIAQAKALKNWIASADFRPTRYITSDWRRAQQTARLLAPGMEWEIDQRVAETDAGEVADWPLIDFMDRYPDLLSDYRNPYPGGESHQQLNQRVLDWLRETVSQSEPQDEVLLVAHSGPISCIIQYVVGIGMERFPAFSPAHATLSIVEVVFEGELLHGRLLAFALGPDRGATIPSHAECRSVPGAD